MQPVLPNNVVDYNENHPVTIIQERQENVFAQQEDDSSLEQRPVDKEELYGRSVMPLILQDFYENSSIDYLVNGRSAPMSDHKSFSQLKGRAICLLDAIVVCPIFTIAMPILGVIAGAMFLVGAPLACVFTYIRKGKILETLAYLIKNIIFIFTWIIAAPFGFFLTGCRALTAAVINPHLYLIADSRIKV